MTVLWRKVARDATRRRVRTGLTVLGVIVGVAGLVAVSATARQLAVAQRDVLLAPDGVDLAVRTTPVMPGLAAFVARHPGVAAVDARVVADASFSAGGPWRGVVVSGIDDGPGLNRPEIVRGRFPSVGEIAFDAGVSRLAPVSLGDDVAVRRAAGGAVAYFTVVGFTRTPAAVDAGILNRVNAYTVPAQVEELVGKPGANQLLVALAPGEDRHAAAGELTRLLDRRGIRHGPVAGPDATLVGAREMQTVVWLLFAFSALGLILSGFLAANTVAAVVQDEFGQIGVLKALGANRIQVAATYLAPALLLCAVGVIGGYVLGLGGGQLVTAYLTGLLGYRLPPVVVTGRELGLAATVGLGVPLAAAVAPALVAARRPVSTLLHTYGLSPPERRGGRLPRVLGGRWPLVAMALRNAPRRPVRAGITVALIAVATAAAVGAEALSASLDATVETLYDRYGADAWIAFDVPADAALAGAVAREPGVSAAEGWSRATGFARGQAIDLWGVPPGTAVYGRRVIAGRWLRSGGLTARSAPREAVASANLARRIGLEPGDVLALDVGNETRDVLIAGIVDDESTYLGSTAAGKLFLAPRVLSAVDGQSAFTFLAVVLSRHDPEGVETGLAALERRFAALGPRSYAAYSDKASTARSIETLTVLLRAMVMLVGLTGLVGVINTLAMNVAERRREVGVTRALGARRPHLVALVMTEGVALGAAGYTLGLVLGYPLGRVLVHLTGTFLFQLSFRLPSSFLALALLATLAACALASVGPALVSARVRPVAVLRYE